MDNGVLLVDALEVDGETEPYKVHKLGLRAEFD